MYYYSLFCLSDDDPNPGFVFIRTGQGFFFKGLGEDPDARQKGKNARQRPYLGKIFCECCFT